MNYTTIPLDTWPGREHYEQFVNRLRCIISITADVDVTNVLDFCGAGRHTFYPTFLYLVSKVLNRHDEFKMGYSPDGALIRWDFISPSHIAFHPEDESVTRLVTEYDPEFATFHDRVREDIAAHENDRGFSIPYDAPNTFDASCLPWISFNACELHIFDSDGLYLAPVVTWGKYTDKDGRLVMPLSFRIHHAVADGFHVARFFSELQEEAERLS